MSTWASTPEFSMSRHRSAKPASTKKESATLVLPQVFAAIQFVPIERLAFEAEARLITLSSDTVYSLTGRVAGCFFGPIFVAGGYRYDKIEIDESDV